MPCVSRLVANSPLDEAAARWLMQLHFSMADRNAALRVYAELAQCLLQESASPPDKQTQDLARLIESASLSSPAHAPAPAHWAALLRPPCLVQREAEWAQLQQAWAAGAAVVITGDAGMGKSRLLEDFAQHMGAPALLRAYPGDAAVPYALLARWVRSQPAWLTGDGPVPAVDPRAEKLDATAQAASGAQSGFQWARSELARLDPRLGAVAEGPLQPLRLSQALQLWASWLPAVVLDDLHHADAASLELLPAVLPQRRCLLASRKQEMPSVLQDWLNRAGQPLVQIELLPLSQAGVQTLLLSTGLHLQDGPAWAALLVRHTGGQPLLLLETLRALLLLRGRQGGLGAPPGCLPMPPRAVQLVRQRLGLLPPEALRVLQLAAVAGESFNPELAAAVLCQSVDALSLSWAALVDAALMSPGGRVHDLVLEAARQSLAEPLSQFLHQAVAAYLAPGGAAPAKLAVHWAAGGQPAQAAACHEAAAAAAGRLSRRQEEAEHLSAASERWAQAGQTDRALAATADAAMAWITAGQGPRGLALCETELARAETPAQLTQLRLAQCVGLVYAGRTAECLALSRQTHAAAVRLGQPRWRAQVAVLAAQCAAMLGQPDEAQAFLADEQALPLDPADWRVNLTRLTLRANALSYLGCTNEALQATLNSITLADRPEARMEQAVQQNNAAMMLNVLGRTQQAYESCEAAWAAFVALGAQGGLTALPARAQRGLFACGLGRFRQGLEDLTECHKDFVALQAAGHAVLADNHLILAWTHLGQPARALALLQATPQPLSPSHRARRTTLRRELSRLCEVSVADEPSVVSAEPIDPTVAAQESVSRARTLPAAQRLARGRELQMAFTTQSRQACALAARLLQLDALIELGAAAANPKGMMAAACTQATTSPPVDESALAMARELQPMLADHLPACTYWPEAQFTVYRAFHAAGQVAEAAQALQCAFVWVEKACREQVPPPFQEGFMRRNKVNVAIQRAWAQHRQPAAD